MPRFIIDPAFWDGDTKKSTVTFPIHCWRWEVYKVHRMLAELVDAHFSPSRLQCTLHDEHEFIIFSTVHLEVKGSLEDVHTLGKLLDSFRVEGKFIPR